MKRAIMRWAASLAAAGCLACLAGCGSEAGGPLMTDGRETTPEATTVDTGPEVEVSPDLADLGTDDQAMDAGAGDEAAFEADLGPQPREAGAPCSGGGECNSGFCVLTPAGMQCTVECQEECPFGWECRPYTPALPDQVTVCLPEFVDLCRPCLKDAECFTGGVDAGEACVSYGPSGYFCGADCAEGKACPEGFACTEALTAAGGTKSQCVLVEGECGCEAWQVAAAATTSCYVENEWGVCKGERACKAGGLTACSAAAPKQEACNGQDDDCDGQEDEGLSGGPCVLENEFGKCPGTAVCFQGVFDCEGEEAEAEACDGMDNDCDGGSDEGFEDTDKDGTADCMEADKDGDGVVDGLDNCPAAFNPAQADFDLDTVGDMCDPDDDNDLVADGQDCMPLGPAVHPGAEEKCNGQDDDCNLIVDEGFADTDFDGWKDCVDDDDDNDGTPDAVDCAALDPSVHPGAVEKCDGLDDDCDGETDEGFPDSDADQQPDCLDVDLDGDSAPNVTDNCPTVANPGQEDLDGDKVGDACDPDADGDAIPDAVDNCLGLKNTSQSDLDGDGLGDACDPDGDGDAVPDAGDNCPLVKNPGQADADKDGIGDACEDDLDGDGTLDAWDCAPADPEVHPGATETCDGKDNDCDFQEDEGFPDLDADGLKNCVDPDDDDDLDPDDSDCAPLNPAISHAALEKCDGTDNDCDGQTDEGMGTLTCGKGQCAHSIDACAKGKEQWCDPYDGAEAEACDGKDNDCDGIVDEDLGYTTCGLGACAHAQANCIGSQEQACDPMLGAQAETCDGKDNDCDGTADEGLGLETCGLGQCAHSVEKCFEGKLQACDPMAGATDELCDGKDNDCDGETDEGFPNFDLDPMPDCADPDDDNDLDPDATDCAPLDPEVGHGQPEVCYNGVDDDCDAATPDQCPIKSCKELLALKPGTQSGPFAIDPDGQGPVPSMTVLCDMTYQGGGWTGFTPIQAYKDLGGTMVATVQAPIDGIDAEGRPYTSDYDGSHSYHYTFNVPFGFAEFWLKDWQVKANAGEGPYVSDLASASEWMQTSWDMAYGNCWGDISYGTAALPGPTTSYARELPQWVECHECTIDWPAGNKVYAVGQQVTTFRMGWGEECGEYEGWYPWWTGLVMVR